MTNPTPLPDAAKRVPTSARSAAADAASGSSFCKVCGVSCTGEFCSKKCRRASTDYHYSAEKQLDEDYQRKGAIAFDPNYLPKPKPRPIVKGRR